MKNKYLFRISSLLICILFLIPSIYSQNKSETFNPFPLNIGNKWQFVQEYEKDRHIERITADSLINNKLYYFYEEFGSNGWLYFNSEDSILYIRMNDSDYVYMDYTVEYGESFFMTDFSGLTTNAFVLDFGTSTYFDSTGHYWTIVHNIEPPPSQSHAITYFFEDVGRGLDDFYYEGSGGNKKHYLIRAIINLDGDTIFYSDHVKPNITFEPDSITSNTQINFTIITSHSHQRMLTGNLFLDSVYMKSFYKGTKDTVINPLIFGEWAELGKTSLINFSLDTLLLNSGYEFYYKIVVKDKGIVPEYAYAPDSGYYQLIYQPTVDINELIITNQYFLNNNYPNPFNPTTNIKYSVGNRELATLKVYDVLGREVTTLVNEIKQPGVYEVEFDGSNLSSGIYYYRFTAGNYTSVKKMILIK